MSREVYVVSAVRTAIGTFGGALKDVPPTQLGAQVVRDSIARAGVDAASVGHVVFGHVVNTEPRDMYLSRVAAIDGGCAQSTPAFNVNRLCGSGLQAIVSASQAILLGDTDVAIGAGAENMSRAPYASLATRFGSRMGDTKLIDMMVGALHDPFETIHMGVTAENIAERWAISRETQDALAVESHRRAEAATKAGHFKDQIVPVILMSGEAVKAQGAKPLARLVAYAHAGVDPRYMGIGPVPATQMALAKAGLSISDLDVIEANEAFAAQACAVTKDLGLDPAKVNPNGSGISLGHPIGATGALITVKAIHELQRIQGRYALVTMCIGGGQGIAAIFERT
jgi:acetyl-CoA C-acetyltransferase